MLTWNFGGDPSYSASTFKMPSADKNFLLFLCSYIITTGYYICYIMIIIMTAKASEAVQKVSADAKDYHKCSLCVIVSI